MAKRSASLLVFCALSVLLKADCAAQLPCRVTVRSKVIVEKNAEIVLRDLLASDSCAPVLHKAGQIQIGRAPLIGSVRVLDRQELGTLLQRALASDVSVPASMFESIPERVVVRSAGEASSCAEIIDQIFPKSTDRTSVRRFQCGAAGRLRKDAPLEVSAKLWDPALRTWDFIARCRNPEDCVPFLVRRNRSDALQISTAAQSSSFAGRGARDELLRRSLVKPGDKAFLIWEADGIRSVTPVHCLDSGGKGDRVRVRPVTGRNVLNATVIAERTLERQP